MSPNPQDWPVLVEKLKNLDETPQNWSPESIKMIAAPTLIIIGDSDVVKPEHAVEMFKLFGGGVPGDLAGLPKAQLAILPGTHHMGVMGRIDWLMEFIPSFLNAVDEDMATKQ